MLKLVFLSLFMIPNYAKAIDIIDSFLETLNVAPKQTSVSATHTAEIEVDLTKKYFFEIDEAYKGLGANLDKQLRLKAVATEVKKRNELLRKELDISSANTTLSKLNELTLSIHQELSSNKVTTVKNVLKYETGHNVGFCFGRALMVHSLLLKKGIKQENIAKIFALGKLTYRQLYWKFHMATMVRGADKSWTVIDNLFEKPLPHAEWMKRVGAMDIREELGQTRFYVTDARKFQPAYGMYAKEQFLLPELRVFFTDLFTSLK
ncbi:MAG TPA: protein-glutamine glutaminase family protein [Bacteriovoracaceae bacterium]|nr:protein-glutamine glutaminase family protein [Bacteriovoracaceae bacterium]